MCVPELAGVGVPDFGGGGSASVQCGDEDDGVLVLDLVVELPEQLPV